MACLCPAAGITQVWLGERILRAVRTRAYRVAGVARLAGGVAAITLAESSAGGQRRPGQYFFVSCDHLGC